MACCGGMLISSKVAALCWTQLVLASVVIHHFEAYLHHPGS